MTILKDYIACFLLISRKARIALVNFIHKKCMPLKKKDSNKLIL